jgi:hypothetical protein
MSNKQGQVVTLINSVEGENPEQLYVVRELIEDDDLESIFKHLTRV